MTRAAIIEYDEAGTILNVTVSDVYNIITQVADGGIMFEDGRLRVSANTLVAIPAVANATLRDLITWWRDGKYEIVEDELVEVEGWEEPVLPEPDPLPEPEIPEL